MLGPIGNSLASQGGLDVLMHGLVSFARALLGGKAQQICVEGRFDSRLDVNPEFSATIATSGEFSSIIQVDLTWPECN